MNANQFYFENPKKENGLLQLPVHLSGLGIKLGDLVVDNKNGYLNSIYYINRYDGGVESRKIDEWSIDYTVTGEFGGISFNTCEFVTELTEMSEGASIDELRGLVERYVASAHSVAVSNKMLLETLRNAKRIEEFVHLAGDGDKGYVHLDFGHVRLAAAVERCYDDASFELVMGCSNLKGHRNRRHQRAFLKMVLDTKTVIEQCKENPYRSRCTPIHSMYIELGVPVNDGKEQKTYRADILTEVEERDVPTHVLTGFTNGLLIRGALHTVPDLHSLDEDGIKLKLNKLVNCFN